jgi:hypothetical protein
MARGITCPGYLLNLAFHPLLGLSRRIAVACHLEMDFGHRSVSGVLVPSICLQDGKEKPLIPLLLFPYLEVPGPFWAPTLLSSTTSTPSRWTVQHEYLTENLTMSVHLFS